MPPTTLLGAGLLSGAGENALRFDIYQDVRSEWRWRTWSGSRIVGASSEGYVRRDHCVDMARLHGYRGS